MERKLVSCFTQSSHWPRANNSAYPTNFVWPQNAQASLGGKLDRQGGLLEVEYARGILGALVCSGGVDHTREKQHGRQWSSGAGADC